MKQKLYLSLSFAFFAGCVAALGQAPWSLWFLTITGFFFSFCNLKWDPNCLNFYQSKKTPISTVSVNQASKPIYKSSVNSNEGFSKYLTENYNVFVVPECNFIIDILKRYYISHSLEESDKQDLLDLIASNRKFSAWGISENLKEIVNFEDNLLISSLIVKILVLLNHQFSPNSILIFNKESYPSVFNQLVKIIWDAKLLYIVRDLRAVYASQKNSIYTKTGQPFSKFGVKVLFAAFYFNFHKFHLSPRSPWN